jgi:hypothetical protein
VALNVLIFWAMRSLTSILVAFYLLQAPPIMPKNNPNGIWESSSGARYELRLSGEDLSVKLVPGSSERYMAYEVNLKNSKDEVNTYMGKGTFTAKVKDDKECQFDTQWQLTVVSLDRILGATTSIDKWDPETCAVQERADPPSPKAAPLDLKKK